MLLGNPMGTNKVFKIIPLIRGHYVPELSNLIYEGNKNGGTINMQGFIVGNPGTDDDWFYFVNQYAFLTFM